MKIPRGENFAEVVGSQKEYAFHIGDSGIIIEYLREKIYTDPIRALCREISCNARDAHREVGTPDKPIKISLPNIWDLRIKIQDEGPGISPDRMGNIFCALGKSTKNENNDEQGGFGLGGKSIFAYSDAFTIETVFDGVKYIYNGVLDESRAGKMVLLHEGETDEPSGTTVIVPVKKEDIHKFYDCIIDATVYWPVKPELSGCDPLPEYPETSTLFEGDGWRIETGNIRRASVTLDDILYTLDYKLQRELDDELLHADLLEVPLVLPFKTGELSLAINRDSLHLDESTKKAIKDRLKKAAHEIIDLLSKDILDQPTYIDACKAFSKLPKIFSRELIRRWFSGICWKDGNGGEFQVRSDSLPPSQIGKWTKLVTYTINYNGKLKASRRQGSKIRFLEDNVDIYHNDKGKGVNRRHIEWLLKNTDAKVIQVISTLDDPNTAEWRRELNYNPSLKATYDLGLVYAIGAKKLSSVKLPRLQRASGRKKKPGHILGYSLDTSRYSSKINTNSAQYPKDMGGVYVQVDYKSNSITTKRRAVLPQIMLAAQRLLGKEVVGFSPKRCEMIDPSIWEPLYDAIVDRINELLLTQIPISALRDADNSYYPKVNNLRWVKNYTDELNDDSPIVKLFNYHDKIKDINQRYSDLITLIKWTGEHDLGLDGQNHIDLYFERVKNLYPLLLSLDIYGETGERMALDYIQSMDRLRELESIVKTIPDNEKEEITLLSA